MIEGIDLEKKAHKNKINTKQNDIVYYYTVVGAHKHFSFVYGSLSVQPPHF